MLAAAALARRDWGQIPQQICSLDVAGARQTTPVEELVSPEDQVFLFVAPSSVEVAPVEQDLSCGWRTPSYPFCPSVRGYWHRWDWLYSTQNS